MRVAILSSQQLRYSVIWQQEFEALCACISEDVRLQIEVIAVVAKCLEIDNNVCATRSYFNKYGRCDSPNAHTHQVEEEPEVCPSYIENCDIVILVVGI